jgi:hypothetical protein
VGIRQSSGKNKTSKRSVGAVTVKRDETVRRASQAAQKAVRTRRGTGRAAR